MTEQPNPEESGNLHRRRITLPDGRYLIFYTFGDSSRPSPDTSAAGDANYPQPAAQPFATEENGV